MMKKQKKRSMVPLPACQPNHASAETDGIEVALRFSLEDLRISFETVASCKHGDAPNAYAFLVGDISFNVLVYFVN